MSGLEGFHCNYAPFLSKHFNHRQCFCTQLLCNTESLVTVVFENFLTDFLEEIRSLRQKYDSSIPILLHCSAGVGRSGVVVLMDQLMGLVDSGEVR